MDRKYICADLKKKITEIIAAIDLNYILAEAKKENYQVKLICGNLKNYIEWSDDICHLSNNYEISTGILYQFISNHSNKIIKINITSDDYFYPLNRNIIIYVPYEKDLIKIKKEYSSVVDL